MHLNEGQPLVIPAMQNSISGSYSCLLNTSSVPSFIGTKSGQFFTAAKFSCLIILRFFLVISRVWIEVSEFGQRCIGGDNFDCAYPIEL